MWATDKPTSYLYNILNCHSNISSAKRLAQLNFDVFMFLLIPMHRDYSSLSQKHTNRFSTSSLHHFLLFPQPKSHWHACYNYTNNSERVKLENDKDETTKSSMLWTDICYCVLRVIPLLATLLQMIRGAHLYSHNIQLQLPFKIQTEKELSTALNGLWI